MKKNLKLIRSFLLLAVLIGSIIVSCSQDDEFNDSSEENSLEAISEFIQLEKGNIHLLEMRSTFASRREQLVIGAKEGIDYNSLVWSNARFKNFSEGEVILVPFRPEEGSKITKALYFGKDPDGNKVMFIYEIDNKLNESLFSLSNRILGTKSKGGSYKSAKSTILRRSSEYGYTEEDWYNFSQYWVEIIGPANDGYSYEDVSWFFEIFVPNCSTCEDEIYVLSETDPINEENYPPCYFDTYGCEGPPDTGNEESGR